jgi:SAM-dependent methyltransferase
MSTLVYQFRKEFFEYMDHGSRRSAAAVVSIIAKELKPESVLDLGCGRGVWLAEWRRMQVRDCLGADGSYVDLASLAIPRECFIACDLARPLDLGRRFDIVQSLEVAQCIDSACADVFVDNLCRHGEMIIFSAAVPGQGGERHVNEQPLDYWREKFLLRGYAVFDWLRPIISAIGAIEPWYRYNTLLFATEHAALILSPDILATRVPPNIPIAEVAPFFWRARKAMLRCLPPSVVQQLALLKHKLHNLVEC